MKINMILLGDISLNDEYISMYNEGINPFQNIESVLTNSDFVIGNLESMAKGDFGENELKKPRLTTTIETLNYLKNINLSVACLANNHVYDHLEDGFNKTLTILQQHQIKTVGASLNKIAYKLPLIIEDKGIKIAILNYVTKDTNPNPPANTKINLNYFEKEKVILDIQKLKGNVNHIVLSLHWGGRVEGGMYPDWNQPKMARDLIDAGADLIIGHHSHTIQPFEVYKDKYIFYSLGNFCFSDYSFNNEITPIPNRSKISSITSIDFQENDYEVVTNYFKNKNDKFICFDKYKRQVDKRNSVFKVLKKYKVIWNFYFLYKLFVLPFIQFIKRNDISPRVKIKRLIKSFFKKIF